MLVWINGPFGAGTTTRAADLAQRRRDAVVDPQHLGVMLRRWSTPHGLGVADRQDFALWRERPADAPLADLLGRLPDPSPAAV